MTIQTDQPVRKELAPGERLLWSGVPRQGIRFRSSDVMMVPFSLMWGGFAFFWEYMVLNSRAPIFFGLWGIPFVLAGIYIIAGRFFVDAYQRTRTFYAITDQRAIIIRGLMSREVKNLPLKNLAEVSLRESGNGGGSIVFGSGTPFNTMFGGTQLFGSRRYQPPTFDLLDDARKVYEILRDAQKRAASAST